MGGLFNAQHHQVKLGLSTSTCLAQCHRNCTQNSNWVGSMSLSWNMMENQSYKIFISLKCRHSSHPLLEMEYAELVRTQPWPTCTALYCSSFLPEDLRIPASVSTFLAWKHEYVFSNMKLQICSLVFTSYFSFLLMCDFSRTDGNHFWKVFFPVSFVFSLYRNDGALIWRLLNKRRLLKPLRSLQLIHIGVSLDEKLESE